QPSRQLGELLAKVMLKHKNAFKVTRISVDHAPEVAQAMGIRALPTVVAFLQGRPADAFSGIPGEADIEKFLSRFMGPSNAPSANLLEDAKTALEHAQYEQAHTLFLMILQDDPKNEEALLGLARASLGEGDVMRAEEVLQKLPADRRYTAGYLSISAGIALFKESAAIEATPSNTLNDQEQALLAFREGATEKAFQILLRAIETQPNDAESKERKTLLKLFEFYGSSHPLTIVYRKALSRLLFS
ncbi:MAG: tetratricopeptide repeat protein, partial [Candidatus Nucleicultricaceae bacterium]